MPAGRPSTYPQTDEEVRELCERVIALGSEGRSEVQISARIDIPRSTMWSWAKEHPEFSAALTRAKELEQDWWETKGQSSLEVKEFNANLWNKSMSARFKSEYGDKIQVAGDKDNPIAHRHDVEFHIVDPGSDQG
jgi:hypothetical protein